MFEEGGHSYPQHLLKDKAQRSEWLKKSKGKETVHYERKWLVGFALGIIEKQSQPSSLGMAAGS